MLHMFPQLRSFFLAFSVLVILTSAPIVVAQVPHRFALDHFENKSCRGKGRLQECNDGPVMRQILAKGTESIPVLISQLGETSRTPAAIEDFWGFTTSGDVAFIILTDLFTDSDGKSFTMPSVPNWETVMTGCRENAEFCWREYVREKGIKSLQQSWQAAWKANRDRVIWDGEARCFRLKK
jgi:hypothetical protein